MSNSTSSRCRSTEVRRSAARLSRDHAQRLQSAAGEPRLRPRRERRSARAAGRSSRTISPRRRTAASPPIRSGSRAASPRRRRWRRYAPARASARARTQVSEEELVAAAGEIGTTIFHPVGTAQDGPARTIRTRWSTRGCACTASAGLRIADASVMPRITSGNTNSPTLMIAEKARGDDPRDASAGRDGLALRRRAAVGDRAR